MTDKKTKWIPVSERLPDPVSRHNSYKGKCMTSETVLCVCVQNGGKRMVKEGRCEFYGDTPVWRIPGHYRFCDPLDATSRTAGGGSMTEQQHQIAVIQWSQQPTIRQKYPELALLFHIPNERSDKVQASILKKMGVKKGVPDLFLPVPSGKYHGLWIEMKTENGRASTEQIWWADHLKANGYAHAFCYGWERATEVLEWYLNLKTLA
jgi:hypothetical protein